MPNKSNTQPNASKRSVKDLLDNIKFLTTEIQELYRLDNIPWVIGYSGGKDSTATLQIVWGAISALPLEERSKPIHVISTDTLVENPIISAWVEQSLKRIQSQADHDNLPFISHQLRPAVEGTFWVNLIGKGYPAPRPKFRWCTERLKIQPSNRFVRDIVRENGETILVLGTRKAESQKRAVNMEKHAIGRLRDRLSPNASLPNSLIYSPIEDWSNDEVWLYLHQFENPWGHSNKELFRIYRGATADNECPLVVDTSTPSCGSSRFGCWVCTLVDRDKSMEAMVLNDESKEWMEPLLEFRDELDFRAEDRLELERQNRDFRRITGHIQFFERNVEGTKQKEVANIPGPYLKPWREHLLTRLLETQAEVRQHAPEEMKDISLISMEELSEIRRIWLEEKHEFDDVLPRIYLEVTGKTFDDPRQGAGNHHLGSDEWNLLAELTDDPIHLERLARLLDTERQYLTLSRRKGILDDLDRILTTSSLPQEEALATAKRERNLKEAAKEGDIETVRQFQAYSTEKPKRPAKAQPKLESEKPSAKTQRKSTPEKTPPNQESWANMKFGTPTTESKSPRK
jgi:DNA sulfur modification protein DndC